MKRLSKGHIKLALAAMRLNRWRSFLTMLGVIAGVASVLLVVGIGEGIKQQVSTEINSYSKDVVTVRPATIGSPDNNLLDQLTTPAVSATLTANDITQIAKLPAVGVSVPLSVLTGAAKADSTFNDATVIGTTANLPEVISQSLAYGTFFSAADANNRVAVLGSNAALQLFDEDVPLGRSFSFRGQQFIVDGVFDSFLSAPLVVSTNFNDAIFIPSAAATQLSNNNAPIYEILAKGKAGQSPAVVANQISQQLAKSHDNSQDFTVLQPDQSLAANTRLLTLLTELIAGVAAISLLVGGIGIMNVMLVSVTERMQEIGVRKAIGATNRQILSQFMVEATALSLTGCLIGIIIAFAVELALRVTTSLTPMIGWQIVLLTVGVALIIGLVFGSVPAFKAARKNPIDALRNE